jgi:hypothetical protein
MTFQRDPAEVLRTLVVNTKLARHSREEVAIRAAAAALSPEKTAEFRGRTATLDAVALSIKEASVHSHLRSPGDAMSQGYEKGAQASHIATLTKAASVITQQQALIGELQSAHESVVKIAAALAEAASLAQDGAIGIEDVLTYARRVLANGSVKTSSLEAYDLSPGKLQATEAEVEADLGVSPTKAAAPALDPFTAFLREAAQRHAHEHR